DIGSRRRELLGADARLAETLGQRALIDEPGDEAAELRLEHQDQARELSGAVDERPRMAPAPLRRDRRQPRAQTTEIAEIGVPVRRSAQAGKRLDVSVGYRNQPLVQAAAQR